VGGGARVARGYEYKVQSSEYKVSAFELCTLYFVTLNYLFNVASRWRAYWSSLSSSTPLLMAR